MRETWRRRFQRAEDLAAVDTASRALIGFYAALLREQGRLYDHLSTRVGWRPSGDLESDLPVLRPHLPAVLRMVADAAPSALAAEARRLLDAGSGCLDQALLDFWREPSDRQFFAKAIVQPYAQWLAGTGAGPIGRADHRTDRRCPFFGGRR